jgi:predicted nucleotide-binding protein (sugar kinase/HSP70/actin superfamily)
MFGMDFLPFWRAFWRHCNFHVVISDPTNRQTVAAGTAHTVAEPCFPVIVALGHLAELLAKAVDYLLVPNTVSAQSLWPDNMAHMCPWGQTLPFVLRRVPAFEPHMHRFLSPCIRFHEGRDTVRKVMRDFCKPLGVRPAVAAAALERACQVQDRFRSKLRAAGREALDELDRTGKPGIIVTGRPYNIHDAGVCLNVARKLRDHYGVNCIPIDCLETDSVDVRPINENMYWEYGRRILATAMIVGRRRNLHIIHVTNFKCGPDSFIKHFVRPASGKPYLSLQFDGHSNDAGMMTRCEAYLDSKGILRPWKRESTAEDAAVAAT